MKISPLSLIPSKQIFRRPPLLSQCATWAAGALTLTLSAASVAAQAPAPAPVPTKPNIVFIMCDDLGYGDLGFHGSNIPTPNVDALAKGGLELTQYYVAPVCTPSRAGLMTGRYWTRFGVLGVQAIRSLPFDTVTTPRALKSVGYDTAQIGKWHLGSKLAWGPNHFGFDYSYGSLGGGVTPFSHFYKIGPYEQTWHRNNEFITEKGHVTDLLGNDAVRWIGARKGNDTPFFLYVAITAPHLPIKEPKEWLDKVPADFTITTDFGQPSPFPPKLYTGLMARNYAACIMHLDYEVGRIVAAIDQAGKRANTLIVFTSDNGAPTNVTNDNQPYPPDNYPPGKIPGSNLPLRGIKGGLYEGAIHVACVANWPGTLAPGKLREPVDIVDWMPTFSALAGYLPDHDLKWDGINVWPFLSQEATQFVPRLLYCGGTAGKELRDGDWKLIMLKPKANGNSRTMLFDLAKDPDETVDLAPRMPEKVEELKQELVEISKADNDAVVPDRDQMLKQWPEGEAMQKAFQGNDSSKD